MPRFLFTACLLCMTVLSVPAQARTIGEMIPCNPNLSKDVRTLPGLFQVHVVCDRVLFEIPPDKLARDMLINVELAALSTGTDYVAPGSVAANVVMRWVRRGNKSTRNRRESTLLAYIG